MKSAARASRQNGRWCCCRGLPLARKYGDHPQGGGPNTVDRSRLTQVGRLLSHSSAQLSRIGSRARMIPAAFGGDPGPAAALFDGDRCSGALHDLHQAPGLVNEVGTILDRRPVGRGPAPIVSSVSYCSSNSPRPGGDGWKLSLGNRERAASSIYSSGGSLGRSPGLCWHLGNCRRGSTAPVCRPVHKHFRCWRLIGRAPPLPVFLSLTPKPTLRGTARIGRESEFHISSVHIRRGEMCLVC